MGNIQTVSLLLSNFCDSLQLRGFIDGIQSLRGTTFPKQSSSTICLYLGLSENNLILKQSFAKTSGNPQKEFLQERRTFRRGNLHVRLTFCQLGQKNSEYGYKYSLYTHAWFKTYLQMMPSHANNLHSMIRRSKQGRWKNIRERANIARLMESSSRSPAKWSHNSYYNLLTVDAMTECMSKQGQWSAF